MIFEFVKYVALLHIIVSYKLQNYKIYTAHQEALDRTINCLRYFWKNLFAQAIYHPKSLLKGLSRKIFFERPGLT